MEISTSFLSFKVSSRRDSRGGGMRIECTMCAEALLLLKSGK